MPIITSPWSSREGRPRRSRIRDYQAISDAGYQPDWVAGISIGGFNAAIIAGNPPEERLGKLEEFWNEISGPTAGDQC